MVLEEAANGGTLNCGGGVHGSIECDKGSNLAANALGDLGFAQTQAMTIHADNQGCIALSGETH